MLSMFFFTSGVLSYIHQFHDNTGYGTKWFNHNTTMFVSLLMNHAGRTMVHFPQYKVVPL